MSVMMIHQRCGRPLLGVSVIADRDVQSSMNVNRDMTERGIEDDNWMMQPDNRNRALTQRDAEHQSQRTRTEH